ncbi:hypothetical protein HH_1609 [Helicobacter hepaticus ATCC 51449]|uniref:Uncharacterized protein n=1 Tax=Helicobacter hepaticus (strain ATCC 51449 / 3B1) TaxID=235279 RepID=Q7VFR6_HELHP|nr:hypothetical protein HH_1609 [Helicobacter hepaticus ATCC 51449]
MGDFSGINKGLVIGKCLEETRRKLEGDNLLLRWHLHMG